LKKTGIHHAIYKDQLSRHDQVSRHQLSRHGHDSLPVEPQQPPELNPHLNQCNDFFSVPEQSSLVAQEVRSPIAVSKHNPVHNPVVTEIVTLKKRAHKNDSLPKKARSKNKKDELPNVAVANPFIIKLKIASNTNKKAKVHERTSDNENDKPFETAFARLEKRRMSLQNRTFISPNTKSNKMQLRDRVDNDYNDDKDNDDEDYYYYDDEVAREEVGNDEVQHEEVEDEVEDDEVKDVVEDEVEDVVEDEVDEVGGHDEPDDDEHIVDSSKMIVCEGDTKLQMNDALLQYKIIANLC